MAKKQKDNRYRQKITVGHDADGSPVYKYASGKTKKELAENTEELRRSYIGGREVQRDVLFGPYALAWYETYKRPNLSIGSRQTYASIFNVHLLPPLGEKQLRAITATELQALFNEKAGRSLSAIRYLNSILCGVFRKAYAEGVIDRDPTVGIIKPSTKKRSRRALTEQEQAAALKVGNEHPEGLLLLLLYYTGMRLGEIIGLQWRDVDFARRYINVERDFDYRTGAVGTLKTPASKRQIPMPDELCAALSTIRGVGNTFVLQSPESHSALPQSTLKRRWQRLAIAMYEADPAIEHTVIRRPKTARKPDGTREEVPIYGSTLTAHYFRHNYASVLYNAGVDILSAQRFMGHADPSITMAVYSHLAKDKEDVNADLVRDAISGKVAKKLPENKKANRNTKSKTPKT